jgi:S1-C subfamily serine protease
VVPASAAEAAGVAAGDVLVKVGEVETRPDEDWGAKFRQRYRGQAGAALTIAVERGGQSLTLTTDVRERTVVSFQLTPLPAPTPKQARVWRGLTTGTTGS